jgi:hypothetical protein
MPACLVPSSKSMYDSFASLILCYKFSPLFITPLLDSPSSYYDAVNSEPLLLSESETHLYRLRIVLQLWINHRKSD